MRTLHNSSVLLLEKEDAFIEVRDPREVSVTIFCRHAFLIHNVTLRSIHVSCKLGGILNAKAYRFSRINPLHCQLIHKPLHIVVCIILEKKNPPRVPDNPDYSYTIVVSDKKQEREKGFFKTIYL